MMDEGVWKKYFEEERRRRRNGGEVKVEVEDLDRVGEEDEMEEEKEEA